MSRSRELSQKRFDVVLAVCAVASIAPLFAARHLPMADLPEHVASMATIRHYYDPSWRSGAHFVIASVRDTPYWLYHAVGALLSVVTGSAERANLVLLAIGGLAYPYALRALLVALRRDPRLAIFGCALFWSTNLVVGLLNFVAAVPMVLYALAVVVRQAEAPTRRRALGLAVLAIGIFYLHLSAFGLFVVEALLLTWLLPSPGSAGVLRELVARLSSLPRRSAWLAPAVVIGALVAATGRSIASSPGSDLEWGSRAALIERAPGWLFDVFKTPVDDVLGVLLVAAFGVLLAAARDRDEDPEARWRSRCAQVVAVAAAAVFLASPSRVGAHALLIDIRMVVFVALFAVLVPRVRDGRRARFAFGAAAVVTLALAANTVREVRGFERDDVAGFDELLQSMPRGKRLFTMNFEPRSTHVSLNVTNYFGSYYRARYGGVASFSFSEVTHWPTPYRPGMAPPSAIASGALSWANPCVYRNGRDGRYFDYVLVRGERDPFANTTVGPRWELIGAARAWRLFRKVEDGRADAPSPDALDVGPCG